jgi:hypothetical protein
VTGKACSLNIECLVAGMTIVTVDAECSHCGELMSDTCCSFPLAVMHHYTQLSQQMELFPEA